MAELKFQQALLQSLVSHDTYMSYSIPFHLITYQMLFIQSDLQMRTAKEATSQHYANAVTSPN